MRVFPLYIRKLREQTENQRGCIYFIKAISQLPILGEFERIADEGGDFLLPVDERLERHRELSKSAEYYKTPYRCFSVSLYHKYNFALVELGGQRSSMNHVVMKEFVDRFREQSP